jgi:PAS domain S-box-containing protein
MSDDASHLALLESEFERVLEERALAASASGGKASQDEELRARARERRFRQLLEALPAAVYTTDAAGRITFYNAAAVELWGVRPELGRSEWCGSWRLFWPDGTPMPHERCPMATALREDRPVRGAEAIAERPDGTRVPFIPYPTPLHDQSGTLVGAVNMLVDITERKRAEEQQALLVRELHHRVKNMLSTVLAIMGPTARASANVEDFQRAFSGRISSLAKTHSRLADDQRQVIAFRTLLRNELDPYDDGSGRRVELDGPAVDLPSDIAVPLGMAVHELTTNAAKYGGLSVLGGSVAVAWRLVRAGGRRQLAFDWIERDGPPVEPPIRRGFGSQLLERVLKGQIGASARLDFAAEGLRAHVLVPLREMTAAPAPMRSR